MTASRPLTVYALFYIDIFQNSVASKLLFKNSDFLIGTTFFNDKTELI